MKKLTPRLFYVIVTCLFCVYLVSACSDRAEYRTNSAVGPLSANARNVLASENPDNIIKAALAFEEAGQFSSALSLYQQLYASDTLSSEALSITVRLGIARNYNNLGQKEKARQEFTDLYLTHPLDKNIETAYVGFLMYNGDISHAQKILSAAEQADTLTTTQKIQLGIVSEISGDQNKARLLWDSIYFMTPENSTVLEYLAISFALDKNYDASVDLLKSLLDNSETVVKARLTLANIYALSGQADAALAIAESVISYEEAQQKSGFYKILPKMSRREQASALLLGQIPAKVIRRLTGQQ